MRDLDSNKPNLLRLNDPIGGDTVEISYRTPTAAELTGYTSGLFKRKKNKLENHAIVTRIRYAKKIIVGIREGDFGVAGKPLASDPKSPNYRADWLDLLEQNAPDILAALGHAVFEGGGRETMAFDEDEDEEDNEIDTLAPLPRNSAA